VSPRDWQVQLFLTKDGTRTCPTGVTFDWTITGEGSSGSPSSDHCDVNAYVKKLGVYRVTAKEMRDGKPTGTTAADDHVVVRDWLIIGLGDSNGSGQGNAPYVDGLCHRSVKSYQYQIAKYIEDQDPHSSVTFVWDACSGAHTDQLWKNSYEGQEPSGGDVLPPQIEQVKSVIAKRKPDAIIMSVGINDLSFSAIMTFCAFYVPSHGLSRDCQDAPVTPTTDQFGYTTRYLLSDSRSSETLAQRTAVQLNSLGGKLQALSAPLAGLDPAHVFITEYPNESTDQTGQLCNNTGPRPRFSSGVWGWLQHVGTGLNGVIAGTASFGWVPVTGVAEGFIGHGYCSTDSYFDTVEQSLSDQHNAIGAFHPNETGAAITASLTRAKVCQALYGNPDCGPRQAACQSTTPLRRPRDQSTFPGCKSRCTKLTSVTGTGPWKNLDGTFPGSRPRRPPGGLVAGLAVALDRADRHGVGDPDGSDGDHRVGDLGDELTTGAVLPLRPPLEPGYDGAKLLAG
jgi:lysophospholipase L1-like esterase